jgi:hypothetical protein
MNVLLRYYKTGVDKEGNLSIGICGPGTLRNTILRQLINSIHLNINNNRSIAIYLKTSRNEGLAEYYTGGILSNEMPNVCD